MIDSSFVKAIQDGTQTVDITVAGKEYVSRPVFNPPGPDEYQDSSLKLSTLTGLVDFVNVGDLLSSDAALVYVGSEAMVWVCSKSMGTYRKRTIFAEAAPILPKFTFGQFMPHAEFMIALQSKFMDFGDKATILRVLGTVKEEAVRTSMDDGVTQTVKASSGIVLQSEVAVPNPVMLKPYRTFLEVDQPPSQFVLRVQAGKSGELPSAALFEADGGRWRNEAMGNVAEYLAAKITKLPVIR